MPNRAYEISQAQTCSSTALWFSEHRFFLTSSGATDGQANFSIIPNRTRRVMKKKEGVLFFSLSHNSARSLFWRESSGLSWKNGRAHGRRSGFTKRKVDRKILRISFFPTASSRCTILIRKMRASWRDTGTSLRTLLSAGRNVTIRKRSMKKTAKTTGEKSSAPSRNDLFFLFIVLVGLVF